ASAPGLGHSEAHADHRPTMTRPLVHGPGREPSDRERARSLFADSPSSRLPTVRMSAQATRRERCSPHTATWNVFSVSYLAVLAIRVAPTPTSVAVLGSYSRSSNMLAG